jgi:hypothetical protein
VRLLQGSEGVVPVLRAAAEHYHAAQAAPIDELSRLLSQVSLVAAASASAAAAADQQVWTSLVCPCACASSVRGHGVFAAAACWLLPAFVWLL